MYVTEERMGKTMFYFLNPRVQRNPFFIGSEASTLNFITENFWWSHHSEKKKTKTKHRRKKKIWLPASFCHRFLRPLFLRTLLSLTFTLNKSKKVDKYQVIATLLCPKGKLQQFCSLYIGKPVLCAAPAYTVCESLPLFSSWDTPRIPYLRHFLSGTLDTEKICWSPVVNSTTVKRPQSLLLYLTFAIKRNLPATPRKKQVSPQFSTNILVFFVCCYFILFFSIHDYCNTSS